MVTERVPQIRVAFDEAIGGYWDGGKKDGGVFTADVTVHPGVGHYVKWGCFRLNHWFTAGSGVSWQTAAANAVRRLRNSLGNESATVTIEFGDTT